MKNTTVHGSAVKAWPILFLALLLTSVSCDKTPADEPEEPCAVSLEELAEAFSRLPLEAEHLREVHYAVSSSVEHGYDEEYTMSDLFRAPGAGVGSSATETKASSDRWTHPVRDLLKDYFEAAYATRAGIEEHDTAADYIAALTQSDVQIYWPYSAEWDGAMEPIVTFDPGEDIDANIGFERMSDGSIKQVVVTEETAMERPVWVINRNDDSTYMTLEMLRRQDPDWGRGGTIVVRPSTRSADGDATRTLILKSFESRRNYDCWFAGASEFFVKAGSIEDFTASTEAEMRLYSPSVTDFMVVMKRSEVGQKIPFNAVLVSEWTEQLETLAFMITEDDGGTRTTWKCSAQVKVMSKTYGFDIELPFNSRDDIVWRGQLTRKYLEKNNKVEGHFGDVYLTFEIN